MKKYFKVFSGTIILSILLFFVFGVLFENGNEIERVVLPIGLTIILLLASLTAQVQYIIELLKKNK